MKGYSAIQCGAIVGSSTIASLNVDGNLTTCAFNNPVKLQSLTLTMLSDIAAGETAFVQLYRFAPPSAVFLEATLDDTCKKYDSIVFDLQDYENSGGDCGDTFVFKVATPATTAATCVVTFNYILIESGEPVWNVGQTVDPAGNLVTGIKQKRNQISGDTSVIRDATPYYARAS